MMIQPLQFDLEKIKEIYASCGWNSYLQDDNKLQRAFENSLDVLGFYINNNLIGFIRLLGDGEHMVLIQDLIIHPKYQHQGYGSKLLQYALEKYKHVRMICLFTDAYDKIDNAFYQKHNFELIIHKDMVAYTKKK